MKIDVEKVAQLANLPLTDEEISKFGKQLDETLSYIENLNEIPTENVEPTNHVTGLENVLVEDKACSSLTQDEALQNAKHKHNGLFKVPAILEE